MHALSCIVCRSSQARPSWQMLVVEASTFTCGGGLTGGGANGAGAAASSCCWAAATVSSTFFSSAVHSAGGVQHSVQYNVMCLSEARTAGSPAVKRANSASRSIACCSGLQKQQDTLKPRCSQ